VKKGWNENAEHVICCHEQALIFDAERGTQILPIDAAMHQQYQYYSYYFRHDFTKIYAPKAW
jgi:hypothetical protein